MAPAGGVGCECSHLLRQDRNQLQGAVTSVPLQTETNTADVYLLGATIEWFVLQVKASSFTLVRHGHQWCFVHRLQRQAIGVTLAQPQNLCSLQSPLTVLLACTLSANELVDHPCRLSPYESNVSPHRLSWTSAALYLP